MQEPSQTLLDQRPKLLVIPFDGKDYPVPLLAPKQNRVVVPIIMRLMPRFNKLFSDGKVSLDRLSEVLDEKTYDELLEMYFLALNRAHQISRAEFESTSVPTIDLISGFNIILKATGLFKEAPAGFALMGEAKGPPSPQTGTTLSPASAGAQDGPGST